MKPSAFVYYGDVEELLKTSIYDEEYLGLFLNDIMGKAIVIILRLLAQI